MAIFSTKVNHVDTENKCNLLKCYLKQTMKESVVIRQTGNRWGLSGFFGWLTATRQGVHRSVEQELSAEMASPTESHFWLAAQIASELFQEQLFPLAEIPSWLPVTLIFSWITIKKTLEDMQRGVAWKVSHFVLQRSAARCKGNHFYWDYHLSSGVRDSYGACLRKGLLRLSLRTIVKSQKTPLANSHGLVSLMGTLMAGEISYGAFELRRFLQNFYTSVNRLQKDKI